MQSSFVDIGLERDAFLYVTDFMEEQGDAADFDSEGGSRRAQAPREGTRDESRPERSEGRRGRSDRSTLMPNRSNRAPTRGKRRRALAGATRAGADVTGTGAEASAFRVRTGHPLSAPLQDRLRQRTAVRQR